jgi:hypothetical protein
MPGFSLYHKKSLAESARPLTQNLVGVQGDNVAERKDEGVDVFHVEVVGGDSIGNGILREFLRLLLGVAAVGSEQLYRTGGKLTHGVISSGSSSIGSYPSFATVTAFRPWLPCGRYESRLTQLCG